MNPKVIEAAAEAILTEFGEVPYYRDMAESAITAALRALAPDIRAAVDALLGASDDYTFALFQDVTGEERFDRSQIPAFNAAIHARYDDLMALLGIPEDGA